MTLGSLRRVSNSKGTSGAGVLKTLGNYVIVVKYDAVCSKCFLWFLNRTELFRFEKDDGIDI